MVKKRKILLILLIVLIVIAISLTMLYILVLSHKDKFLPSSASLDKMVNTKWSLKKIKYVDSSGETSVDEKDFKINHLFDESMVSICFSSDDCTYTSYNKDDNGYVIDYMEGNFLYGIGTLSDDKNLILDRELDDGGSVFYYFVSY